MVALFYAKPMLYTEVFYNNWKPVSGFDSILKHRNIVVLNDPRIQVLVEFNLFFKILRYSVRYLHLKLMLQTQQILL